MPMVQAKCENCGGILAVDSDLKAANCPFCGTAYIVQDSINYYNSTVNIDNSSIANVQANVVNINDERTSEGRLKAADAYMQINKFDEALREYKEVTRLTPHNYRGWQGMIEAFTCRFGRRIRTRGDIRTLEDYGRSVRTFSSDEQSKDILQKLADYIEAQRVQNRQEKAYLVQQIEQTQGEVNALRAREKELKKQISDIDKTVNRKTKKINTAVNSKAAKNMATFTTLFFVIMGIMFLFFGMISKTLLWLGVICIVLAVLEASSVLRKQISVNKLASRENNISNKSMDLRRELIKQESRLSSQKRTLETYE